MFAYKMQFKVRNAGFFLSSGVFFAVLSVLVCCSCSAADAYQVKSITTIKDYGRDLDWSGPKDRIISCKIGEDGYYDVFVMKPDGSQEKNLTHNKPGCPQKHAGNVAWHPLGDFIVFTAENEDTPSDYNTKMMAIPGNGFNCNLWLMNNDGSRFWKLTDYPTEPRLLKAKAVIHPQFSHDGKKILWAERIGPGNYGIVSYNSNESDRVGFKNMSLRERRQFLLERRRNYSGQAGASSGAKQDPAFAWGEWALKIADFIPDANNPRIANIRTYQPGEQHALYESHAWSSDDKKILFTANLLKGQPVVGLDIYEMDLAAGGLKNLTNSFNDWDEQAHYFPGDNQKVVWMSSTGFAIKYESVQGLNWRNELKTELCIMNRDGSAKQRLTHFNEPGYPEYMNGERCVVSDNALSPDGSRIIACVAYVSASGRIKTKLVMIEL